MELAAGKESGGLWPLHLKPQSDELLSSWLLRLARAHRLKAHTFCSLAWPSKQIWNRDVDKSVDVRILETLSAKTGTPIERVRATTLNAYENILYARHNILGPNSWIMPLGVYHRIHTQFGLQYCPLCLAEDEKPYYRRKWRLAFIISCQRHNTLLHDRCPSCGAAINFHRNELGNHRKVVADSLTRCHSCRLDLRAIKSCFISHVTKAEGEFTAKLLRAIDEGFVPLSDSVATYSQMYFAGLRQLMKIAAMRDKRIDKLRQAISEEYGVAVYSPPVSHLRPDVHELDIEARRQLLTIARCLLEEWPRRFVELSSKYKVWSSCWLRHLDPPARPQALPAPFWFWSIIHNHLYRAKHSPSDEEIKAAINYLERTGEPVNRSSLARLLGVAALRRGNDDLLLNIL